MSGVDHRVAFTPAAVHTVTGDADMLALVEHYGPCHRIDPVRAIADDLFELEHPDRMHDDDARERFVGDILAQGSTFGRWVYYPWMRTLVRVAEPDLHYRLRTFRNRNLVTVEEQARLRTARIAVFGLSVGSNVVDRTAQAGIGAEYLLFDPDRLSPSNLNRLHAGIHHVGLPKTTISGRKIAELDPYVRQTHFPRGYEADTDDVLRRARPDVIIEEVDNLEVKVRLRRLAAELKVPLVTAGDVGDVTTVDVERHDREPVAPFHGRLSDDEVDGLAAGRIPRQDYLPLLIKILGRENISDALLSSAQLVGRELGGVPQLGSTAAVGGALAAVAVREVLLGRPVPSRSSAFDARGLTSD